MQPPSAPIVCSDVPGKERSNLEDPLAYLPCAPILEYRPGQAIYECGQASSKIFLIVEGKVKISHRIDDNEVVVDVYQADEFFGESALAESPIRQESAIALEKTRVMSWSRDEIMMNALSRPRLAIGLLQITVGRLAASARRLESLSIESVHVRLQRTLLGFAERFGTADADGSVHMKALTHELLSQCVGTSREIVTHHMGTMRREGYLEYSRENITLRPCAFTDWLGAPRLEAPRAEHA